MRTYLYLGRRDKKGVRLVATFLTKENLPPSRISKIEDLHLPENLTKQIGDILHEHRMMWEPWMETADSWQSIKESLRKRGYKNIPHNAIPTFRNPRISEDKKNVEPVQPDAKKLIFPEKIMMKKRKG